MGLQQHLSGNEFLVLLLKGHGLIPAINITMGRAEIPPAFFMQITVTCTAQSCEVVQVIGTTEPSRYDVMHLQKPGIATTGCLASVLITA